VARSFVFEEFVLNTQERQLKLRSESVELNGRYLDALALLVSEPGKLISKDRFLNEVWSGIPVTDEALTQCIKTLRRQLGDDAANPRFIETVPKHGYRFIAPVELGDAAERPSSSDGPSRPRSTIGLGLAGTVGGAAAGTIGGLACGLIGASQASSSGVGGISVLLVLLCITLLVAVIGAAGVSFSIAIAKFAAPNSWQWTALAGAGGGLLTGALAKLLGLDAFTLLVGHAPAEMTGAMEGIWLGGAVGLAAGIAKPDWSIRRTCAFAALFGGAAGLIISLLGGRLMLGSLALVGKEMPGARLHFDTLGKLLGEAGFGPRTATLANGCEAALFCACVVCAMTTARRLRPGA
jgi:DNA-binding winged helix-turn-helix (wHTH) protein